MTLTQMDEIQLELLGTEVALAELSLRGDPVADRNRERILRAEHVIGETVGWDEETWYEAHLDLEEAVMDRFRLLEAIA